MAALTYGGGLRLLECLRLRVKALDFDRGEVTIRDAKGQKDRATMLPRTLIEPLRTHLSRVRLLHERDVADATVAWTAGIVKPASVHTLRHSFANSDSARTARPQ